MAALVLKLIEIECITKYQDSYLSSSRRSHKTNNLALCIDDQRKYPAIPESPSSINRFILSTNLSTMVAIVNTLNWIPVLSLEFQSCMEYTVS